MPRYLLSVPKDLLHDEVPPAKKTRAAMKDKQLGLVDWINNCVDICIYIYTHPSSNCTIQERWIEDFHDLVFHGSTKNTFTNIALLCTALLHYTTLHVSLPFNNLMLHYTTSHHITLYTWVLTNITSIAHSTYSTYIAYRCVHCIHYISLLYTT